MRLGPDNDRVTSPLLDDDRPGPPFLARDRESLETWLEFYRSTLPLKVGGSHPTSCAFARCLRRR